MSTDNADAAKMLRDIAAKLEQAADQFAADARVGASVFGGRK